MATYRNERQPPLAWRHGTLEREAIDQLPTGLGNPSWLPIDGVGAEQPAPLPASAAGREEPVPANITGSSEASQSTEHAILEGLKVVCICKGIRKRTLWQAMEKGSQTREEINRETGSGSGGCRGRRCGPRITAMLHDDTSRKA